MKRDYLGWIVLIVCGLLTSSVWAWHGGGHESITRAAVAALPPELPAFLREGAEAIAHSCVDPDTYRNPSSAQLGNSEEPEHFIDMELLEGKTLPATRYEYLKLCYEMKLDPRKVGLLPYAILEWTQRLTLALAEYRRWPHDPYIRAKCLYIAGILAHYSADLGQPLHLTIHFDGKAGPDGSSPRSGIHAKVDALIENLGLKADSVKVEPPQTYEALFPAILTEIQNNRALIPQVYAMESKLPAREARKATVDPQVQQWARDRLAWAGRFTANLFLTAWHDSEKVKFPRWLDSRRPTPGPGSPGNPGSVTPASGSPGNPAIPAPQTPATPSVNPR